jgi:hypothetical protein
MTNQKDAEIQLLLADNNALRTQNHDLRLYLDETLEF